MISSVVALAVAGGLVEAARRHHKRAHALRTRPRADELHHARTGDGWRIALHRWRGKGDPVLLCHGLGACAATWELGHGPSLARWLQARGHDVFALELRGAGDSDRPRFLGGRGYEWGIHEYLTQDIPAAMERVLELSGRDKLHWVGHSMGGVLLFAFAPTDLGDRLATATTVGSAFDYTTGSDFSRFHSVSKLLRLLRVAPMGSAARAYAPFAGTRFLDDFMFAPENLTPEERRAIWASGFTWISGRVLLELATTFDPGGFRGRDGTLWLPRLRTLGTPLLMIAGTRDRQCTPAMARGTFETLGSPRKKLVTVDGLGHFDLLVGRRAEGEVYPAIGAWLAG